MGHRNLNITSDMMEQSEDNNLRIASKMKKQTIIKKREAFHALRAGELDKNIELFTDAIRFDPQFASVYLMLLKPIAAIRNHDKAIKVNPDALGGKGRLKNHSTSWVASTRLPEASNKHTSWVIWKTPIPC